MQQHLLAIGLIAVAAATLLIPSRTTSTDLSLSWQLLPTNSRAQFRGLSPISKDVAWVSGTQGTVLRTSDGGATWASVGPSLAPEDVNLEFRDIQAFSELSAVILSIGSNTNSRVYATSDGGATWRRSFTNEEPAAFFDCLAFEDSKRGMAMSDPVDGKFRLIETKDGGESWSIVDPAGMPPALAGEFGFAASGTCLATKAGRWYLASGGVDPGRVFRSEDGYVWQAGDGAIKGGESAGVYSVQFQDALHGVAVGGDYTAPNGTDRISSWSEDGGLTWTASTIFPGGYRSGSSWLPGLCSVALAVGPTGSDITVDGGRTWTTFDNGTFDSVECLGERVCWASGTRGRVAKLVIN